MAKLSVNAMTGLWAQHGGAAAQQTAGSRLCLQGRRGVRLLSNDTYRSLHNARVLGFEPAWWPWATLRSKDGLPDAVGFAERLQAQEERNYRVRKSRAPRMEAERPKNGGKRGEEPRGHCLAGNFLLRKDHLVQTIIPKSVFGRAEVEPDGLRLDNGMAEEPEAAYPPQLRPPGPGVCHLTLHHLRAQDLQASGNPDLANGATQWQQQYTSRTQPRSPEARHHVGNLASHHGAAHKKRSGRLKHAARKVLRASQSPYRWDARAQ